jgi:hypothetical protein
MEKYLQKPGFETSTVSSLYLLRSVWAGSQMALKSDLWAYICNSTSGLTLQMASDITKFFLNGVGITIVVVRKYPEDCVLCNCCIV